MTDVQQRLLSCLSSALYEEVAQEKNDPELLEEARTQAVSSLVCEDHVVLASNVRVIVAHAELTKLLAGLPFTTFKGYASAHHYPNPILRPMGDVDFITESDAYESVTERLEEGGWRRIAADHVRHVTFVKSRVHFELHTEIKGVPNGLDGIAIRSEVAEEMIRQHLSDIVNTAVAVETQDGQIMVPDDYHHALVMLLHMAGHIINDGGVGLRHLCDWAVFAKNVDVGGFGPRFEEVGLWTFARQLTAAATRYLGLPEQQWAGEWDETLSDAIIEDFLRAGNFGCRETGRAVSLELEGESLVKMVKRRFPEAERHPFLVPAYMARWAMRYVAMVAMGKRKPIELSTVLSAKSRRGLYKQFRLFEV